MQKGITSTKNYSVYLNTIEQSAISSLWLETLTQRSVKGDMMPRTIWDLMAKAHATTTATCFVPFYSKMTCISPIRTSDIVCDTDLPGLELSPTARFITKLLTSPYQNTTSENYGGMLFLSDHKLVRTDVDLRAIYRRRQNTAVNHNNFERHVFWLHRMNCKRTISAKLWKR